MADQFALAADALHAAAGRLSEQAPDDATALATIGVGHALMGVAGQLHLANLVSEHQALCTLAAGGLLTDTAQAAMELLERRITEGLGLR